MNIPLHTILKNICTQTKSFKKTEFVKKMKEKHSILKNNHTFILPSQIDMKLYPGDLFRYGDENFISGLCIIIKVEYKKVKNLDTSMSDKYIDHFVIKTGDIYKKLFINNYFFLADEAYDTKEIKNLLKNELHYKILIKENKRNNKNKKEKMTESKIEIYKNRLSIERTFNRIKNNKKIMI